MQYTKRQHYVPRTYLEAWGLVDGKVCFRRRDLKISKVTSIANLCLENQMYGTKELGNHIENQFSVQESSWPRLRNALLNSRINLSWDIKIEVAMHIAVQSSRGRDFKTIDNFSADVRKAIGDKPSDKQIEVYLQTEMGNFKTTKQEIEAVRDIISISNSEMESMNLDLGFDPHRHIDSLKSLAGYLAGLHWRVETNASRGFICADTPVIKWKRRSEEDNYRGYGFKNSQEIWFPVDPWHLLVLAPLSGRRGFWSVTNSRVNFVNQEIASRCFEFVFSTMGDSNKLDQIELNPTKPALRFNKLPSTYKDSFGRLHDSEDLIQFWIPPHD